MCYRCAIKIGKSLLVIKMAAFVALLDQNKFVATEEEWVENLVVNSTSRVFNSPDEKAVPDFNLPKMFYSKNSFCLLHFLP